MSRFWAWMDKYYSRWTNVWFNVGLGVLFVVIALFMPGWARDVWMLSAGLNFGYAFMWLTYPRFTKARQRELDAQIALIISESLYRMTRQTFGHMTVTEADEENKRTLQ